MKRIIIFSGIAFFWLAMWGGFIIFNEYILNYGTEVLVGVTLYDPRDLLRGDYVHLNYGGVPNQKKVDAGEVVFVSLEKGEEGYYKFVGCSTKRPSGGLFIKGKSEGSWREKEGEFWVSVIYGIERFYIREGTGVIIEKALREASEKGGKLAAKVMINRWGNPILKSLVLKDRERAI